MKTRCGQGANLASVLLVALLMALIIGFTLGGYLLWVGSQNVLTRESHAWNAALVVAEAGIEEGMAHINTKFGGSNFAANGWSMNGDGFYRPQELPRALVSGGATNGTYGVSITNSGGLPILYSTGYTMVPLVGQLITRTIELRTAKAPTFQGAMAARSNVVFNGNEIRIDSYDSMDPNYNTNGMYDASRPKAGGDVASRFGIINIGNATVKGKLRTGPNSAPPNLGPLGSVGDLSWIGPGIQPTWYLKDFNADFKDATLPDNFSPVQPGVANGTTNIYVLGNGDYYVSSLMMRNPNDNLLVTGNARLHVLGELLMQGKPIIQIEPGASLEIYVSGASATFTQVNTSGNANSFRYFGLPSNTVLNWSGNDQYVGTVYAPQATFNLGGGGANEMDYQGACVVKAATLNGRFKFHYDEALARGSQFSGYVASSWKEL